MNKRILSGGLAVFLAAGLPWTASYGAPDAPGDPSFSEQWAFYNDGTFSIEEEKNRYPVYDDPFGQPSAPGDWRFGEPELLGVLVQVERIRARAGIDAGMTGAWAAYGEGKRDVVVAVIDTGIDISHEDLAEAVWVNEDEIPGNGIDDDGNGYVDDVNGWNFYDNNNQICNGSEDSHGTHGAGTICAVSGNGLGISGMIPGDRVRIMPVKALGGGDGEGNTAALIRAIRYAEDNGASICNLSLTSPTSDQALYYAMRDSSMLFVAAAGNDGKDIDEAPVYPASYELDNVISVANLSCGGELHETSNYGVRSVDLAAPGSYILSTTPGNTYSYMTGTSMAAPMVTGAAAMVWSHFDGIGAAEVKEILLNSVTPLDSLSGKTGTGGMLNVGAALEYDLGTLSGRPFETGGHRPENGTAPYLEARVEQTLGGLYLKLRVIDIDGDLEALFYAPGEQDAGWFREKTDCQPFTVSERDIAAFRIGQAGVYTFYARDRKGNDTAYTVKIADLREGPGVLAP